MTVGPLIMTAGLGWLAFLAPGDGYLLGVLPGILLFGLGLATTVAPLTTTAMDAVETTRGGLARA